ncbi:ATP-binding domain-containing protein, partial [bacterium]|nr:ATP-binding domain-containing protein [bacterium]
EMRSISAGRPFPEVLDAVINQFFGDFRSKASQDQAEIDQLILKVRAAQHGLRNFLDAIMLSKELDDYDEKSDQITLSTLHAAKGLEFPIVYILGCEENFLPYRKESEALNLDEERRLMYVGMTRAKEKLILTHSRNRFLFGRRFRNRPSQFVQDIQYSLKQIAEGENTGNQRTLARKRQMNLF